jgi:anti-sigma-K factor RskA
LNYFSQGKKLPPRGSAVDNIKKILAKYQLGTQVVKRLVYTEENAREHERWHPVWLMTPGWTATQVAKALERDGRTIGEWMENLDEKGVEGFTFEQSGGSPPASAQYNKRH